VIRISLGVASFALVVAVAACGGSVPSGSSVPTGPAASPGTSAPAGSGGDLPGPSRWPGDVWRAALALGAADNEIGEATADLQRSIEEEDISLMREAAGGLAGLTVLLERVDDVESFEPTRAFAGRYREGLSAVIAAASELQDAIDATDAPRIQQANLDLAEALATYVRLRPELSDIVAQAFEQQRLLLN
jgi:hypothetical protein